MAFNKPTWVSTWATAATSPIHGGVEGTDVGFTWIVTEACVILLVCPPCLERDTLTNFLTRSHISTALRQFPSYCSVRKSRCASRGHNGAYIGQKGADSFIMRHLSSQSESFLEIGE